MTITALDQCWVCFACGKRTKLGAARETLRDTSCITAAVLCYAEQVDGVWQYTPVHWADLGAPRRMHNRSTH